jgi:hypothetical protein
MTEELDEIRKEVRAMLVEHGKLTEKVETLIKVVKLHEHDKRDGCTKVDVGYL